MNTLNFDTLLIHSSAFSKLTTEPKAVKDKEAGLLSVTTKTHLKEIFLEEKYGRRKEINTKQMRKGTLQEEDAITLYCRLHKKMFNKNVIRFNNEFVTGEPDLVDNIDQTKITKGVDIKCSWSIFSFPFPDDKLDKSYEWQNQCYMFLTGAVEWITAHCLVNAPGHMITAEKLKALYQMRNEYGADIADDDPEYLLKCLDIEKNMIFDMGEFKKAEPNYDTTFQQFGYEWKFDIPLTERVIEFHTTRDKFMIESIPDYVKKARRYLNQCANGEF